MAKKFTPMMEQYFEIKKQYEDCLLLYRLGDFYEMFFDDAQVGSEVLGLTLTGRDCGQKERAPMCGVPFHAVDSYISKLVENGYKVAICEQTEDPATAKGIVKRDVIRVITPGTIVNDSVLDSQKTNYLCAIYKNGQEIGMVFSDLSTGELMATSFSGDKSYELVTGELARFAPVEITLNEEAYQEKTLMNYINDRLSAMSFTYKNDAIAFPEACGVIQKQFHEKYDSVREKPELAIALAILICYLNETQKVNLAHITEINFYTSDQFMNLDSATQRNLELVETMRDKAKRGSLFWVLDQTATSMGARTLKKWLLRPLLSIAKIKDRLNAVEELTGDMTLREELHQSFRNVHDIERLMGKVAIQTANARDLVALKESFLCLPNIKTLLSTCRTPLLQEEYLALDTMEDLADLLERAIQDEPPVTLRDGGLIKTGFHEEIDTLRNALTEGKDWIDQIEAEEREATGIKNLKVGFNKVFGYYIEVSNSNKDKVPDSYVRKQTLTNGERYITPKLKEIENIVLGANERITVLEYQVFLDIRERVKNEIERIHKTAQAVAVSDALCSLATVAVKQNYRKPEVNLSDKIVIRDGRHPVVEKVLKDALFVPNDTDLNESDQAISVITGPNMAGKSTYMRQVALISLMAQVGSFVPAEYAEIGLVDQIFTRVGASDDLASGQSTFMVEMNEVANILKHATKKSLLILDEIGRGTSTYDGLSIAWAVVEYISEKIGARTLFATHYHELTELEGKLKGVLNYCIAVKKRGDDITFLRKIIRGGADESYGIEVALLAGIPKDVVKRAKRILSEIDMRPSEPKSVALPEESPQIGFEVFAQNQIREELLSMELSTLTPIEALNKLYELQKIAKEM